MRLGRNPSAIVDVFGSSPRLAFNLPTIFGLITILVGATAGVLVELNMRSEFSEAEMNAHKTAYILLHNFEQTVEPIDSPAREHSTPPTTGIPPPPKSMISCAPEHTPLHRPAGGCGQGR